MEREGRSVPETPTWAVATIITVLVAFGFLIHGSLKRLGKWLDRTKRKALLAALQKIKEELMLFGMLSLLMGHWIIFFAKICIKSSAFSSHFYPCIPQTGLKETVFAAPITLSNSSLPSKLINNAKKDFCPEGRESFTSYESLEQLHRFLLVLSITHVFYSFVAVVLAMIKINSWRRWEDQVKSMFLQESEGSEGVLPNSSRMRRLSTFICHQTSHPWSQHKVLVWLLCFSRQFWSSINQADYKALRLGFITLNLVAVGPLVIANMLYLGRDAADSPTTSILYWFFTFCTAGALTALYTSLSFALLQTHQLSSTYDFHKYMLRSMEEEFRDIVGISIPLWIFSISCILLGYHGTNIYFWISFIPAILILLIGTKLHRVVVKLAVEVMDDDTQAGFHQFHLRDELFWFAKPRLLLLLIQFVSFQNAFEMATYIWLLWEGMGKSCFTQNQSFIVIRLVFGLVSQFWCSFVTFPLYIIVTQMGSTFQKSIISENVRRSLHGWCRKAKTRRGALPYTTMTTSTSTASLDSMADEMEKTEDAAIPNQNTLTESIHRSDQRFDKNSSGRDHDHSSPPR